MYFLLLHVFCSLVGMIFAWNSLDHILLSEKGIEEISPELSRSGLWCCRRFISALRANVEADSEDSYGIPKLEGQTELSRLLIEFTLHRTFTVLNRMSGEKR